MKESKSMMRKELSFMKKKGAPKSMVKHEEAEMEGKKVRKFAAGGMSYADMQKQRAATRAREASFRQANSVEARAAAQRAARSAPPVPRPAAPMGGAAPAPGGMGGAGGTQQMIKKGGAIESKKYAHGGGIESKGKTRGEIIKMAEGGRYAPPSNATVMAQVAAQRKTLMDNAPGMGLQKRQFGTGPGQTPMPKHLGKAVTDRGKAIMGKAGGGSIGSASKRADGIASKGKTRGKMC